MIPKLLIVGCGDIGIRLAGLVQGKFHCVGLRRNAAALPSYIEALSCDLNATPASELPLTLPAADFVVVTLVPNTRSEAGYRQAYVTNLQKILAALAQQPPKLLLFASSTSVYGQDQGEWVDEQSPTQPAQFNGRVLLEAEQLLQQAPFPTCTVRFSGIYGPGRERLINAVKATPTLHDEDNSYSNRIHVDDCAGVLAHLLQRQFNAPNTAIAPCYLASDCEPVPSATVKHWLAKQLRLPPAIATAPPENANQLRNKRCSNQQLLATGYKFIYPSYREGYGAMLAGN